MDVCKAASLVYKSDEEFGVEREHVRRIDAAALFIRLFIPEDRWLLQIESPIEITQRRKWGLPPLTDVIAIGIDPPRVAVNNIGPAGIESLGHGMQCSGGVQIVGVQISHDVAGGSPKPLCNGIGGAGVFLRDPVSQALLVTANDVHGLIR